MKRKSKYRNNSKITFVFLLITITISFIGIHLIQHVLDISKYNNADKFEIKDNQRKPTTPDSKIEYENEKDEKVFKENNNNNKQNRKVKYDDFFLEKTSEGELEYIVVKNTNIFDNNYFNSNIIAPGVNGNYFFDIINNRNQVVVYNITATDKNDYGINLEYRLKKGDTYIVGNETTWKKIINLNINDIHISPSKKDKYILEWRWPYESGIDNIDSEIGEEENANYQLTISIKAKDI